MKILICILYIILFTPCLFAQTDSTGFKKYSSQISKPNLKISQALLAGGITSSTLGTASLITASLESKSHNSLTSTTTPFLITGVALNLICMPVCFVVREVIRKKAHHQ